MFLVVVCWCADRTSSLDHFHDRKSPSKPPQPAADGLTHITQPPVQRITSSPRNEQRTMSRSLFDSSSGSKDGGCQVGADCDCKEATARLAGRLAAVAAAAAQLLPLWHPSSWTCALLLLHLLLLGGFFWTLAYTQLSLCRQKLCRCLNYWAK